MSKRVIVIGAGTSGLCAAKNAIENGFAVTVYEQSEKLGGLWNYTDETGVNKHGLPYGYMYRDLKTNVPKEIMRFTDYDVPINDKSFLSADEVINFLKSYADEFQLHKMIQFQQQVIRVLPLKQGRWEVLLKDLQTDIYSTESCDFIMVCNGHHFKPWWPSIKGQQLFGGMQKHSLDFRVKEEFQDKRVLVIGSGPSALDIAVIIANCASIVFLAHHIPFRADTKLSDNITLKPDVEEVTSTGAVFIDGSDCEVDAILYCTGFKYSFPFLSTDCGIYVEGEKYVRDLFKQTINIRRPTMAFIGLNFLVAAQMHFDLQSQFVAKVWATGRQLPSKEEMLKDTEEDLQMRLNRGWQRRHAHKMGDLMADYYRQMAEYADIRIMPNVYLKIWKSVGMGIFSNYLNYRKFRYNVIDEETFEKTEEQTSDGNSSAETNDKVEQVAI